MRRMSRMRHHIIPPRPPHLPIHIPQQQHPQRHKPTSHHQRHIRRTPSPTIPIQIKLRIDGARGGRATNGGIVRAAVGSGGAEEAAGEGSEFGEDEVPF